MVNVREKFSEICVEEWKLFRGRERHNYVMTTKERKKKVI